MTHKYWRELYLTVMVSISLTIIAASTYFFQSDTGLVAIAAGVFVSVLGVGFYDQWQAETARVQTRTRR